MPRVTNVYLVRWAQGWLEVDDAASIAANGRHEEFFSAGQANTVEEATRLADVLLDANAPARDDQVIEVEPIGAGDEPYTNFAVGDTVTAPDKAGAAVSRRVARIAVTADGEGNAYYRLEFEKP